jgi:heme a synthase
LKTYRALCVTAAAAAFCLVVLGAYVRLSNAGLGCPDWPLCYGRALPAEISDAGTAAKAWKEMAHRYVAGGLGVLIVVLLAAAWRLRRSRALATAILVLVALQATLGKWTVTMLLKPVIVTAHLLGGMTTLALLTWLALAQWPHAAAPETRTLRAVGAVALAALIVQIALGGWVSANYAALACPDLPLCRGALVPPMDFASGFHLVRELGQSAEGRPLSPDALTAIHWSHRVFALVVVALAALAAARARRAVPILGALVAAAVLLQFALGVANVAAGLPLALAAAHNAGAALLLVSLVVLNFFAFRGLRPSR